MKFIASQASKTRTADGGLKLKVIMVVHFVQGGGRNNTPAKYCKPVVGKRLNQFSNVETRRN